MKDVWSWSFSKVGTYETCALKYKYRYIEKLSDPAGPSAERGTKLHGELELHLGKKTMPDWMKPHHPHLKPFLTGGIREMVLDFDKGWKLMEPTEGDRGVIRKRYWFRAVIDLFTKRKKTGSVIDYKSGKIYPEHVQQVELYSALSLKAFPELETVGGRDYYIDLPPGTWSDAVTVNQKDATNILGMWEDRAKHMFGERIFAPRPGRHCVWCNFSKRKGGPCPVE